MSIPRYRIIRDADFGFGVPLLGRLFRRRGPMAELLEDFPFRAQGQDFLIPAGYHWNGASIPALLWGPPWNYQPFGTHVVASLVHDFLCDLGAGGSDWLRGALYDQYPTPLPWQDAHQEFYLRCLAYGAPETRAKLWWSAVHHFGPRWKLPLP
jgi:hypothetical protein